MYSVVRQIKYTLRDLQPAKLYISRWVMNVKNAHLISTEGDSLFTFLKDVGCQSLCDAQYILQDSQISEY